MRGENWQEEAGKCPSCQAPSLKAEYYEFAEGPKLINYFCSNCSTNFSYELVEEDHPSRWGIESAQDKVNLMVEKFNECYKACGHQFGIEGDDGRQASVRCIRCGYGGIMRLEKTIEFPEYWEAWGRYIGMPELGILCRAVVNDVEAIEKEAVKKLK